MKEYLVLKVMNYLKSWSDQKITIKWLSDYKVYVKSILQDVLLSYYITWQREIKKRKYEDR